MSIRKDKIVVVDLEATCWEGFNAPPGQENEIIEIGICLFDPATNQISDKRGILVKPINSVISEFCTQLTSITPEMITRSGISFGEACEILETEYDTRNRLWISWGAFDRTIFLDQCKSRKVRYPFSKKHANLKRVFQDRFGERMGLARAMTAVGLTQEGTAHRGDDDAYNTANLLSNMLQQYGHEILHKYGW